MVLCGRAQKGDALALRGKGWLKHDPEKACPELGLMGTDSGFA
jgi:hypothetical protein